MAVLVLAHPYPDRSRANRRLVDGIRDLEGLEIRSLYELYPDFDIDTESEQKALSEATLIIWQHPMYWYSVPGLLKHWFDKVLCRGWAYGGGAAALRGKRCLWVTTTGADESAFRAEGVHGHPMASFVPPVKQTARFCGMHWLEPIVIHGAHQIPDAALDQQVAAYRQRIQREMSESEHGS